MQLAQPTDPVSNWNLAPADTLGDLGSLWDTPAELWNLAANMPTPTPGQTADPGVIPLGSVGSGTANFLDDLPAVVQPKRTNSKEDRKLAVSREAQKRFRQRQKVPCKLQSSCSCLGVQLTLSVQRRLSNATSKQS